MSATLKKGGDFIDVSNQLSDVNKRTFASIATLIDCDPVGIDFMGTDLTTDIRTQEYGGIVETNASPGFGYGPAFTWLADRAVEHVLIQARTRAHASTDMV